MKAYLVFSGTGPILVLTARPSLTEEHALARLKDKGLTRFIAYPLPLDTVKARYADHYNHVFEDTRETDDLRVLDPDGEHAFGRFGLSDFGSPVLYEETPATASPA